MFYKNCIGPLSFPNENSELILMRVRNGWRMCVDFKKLNETTRKDLIEGLKCFTNKELLKSF